MFFDLNVSSRTTTFEQAVAKSSKQTQLVVSSFSEPPIKYSRTPPSGGVTNFPPSSLSSLYQSGLEDLV